MRKYKLRKQLVVMLIFFNPLFLGLIFGLFPCYSLPYLDSLVGKWCTFQSPFPGIQFIVGAVLSLVIIGYLIYKILRERKIE